MSAREYSLVRGSGKRVNAASRLPVVGAEEGRERLSATNTRQAAAGLSKLHNGTIEASAYQNPPSRMTWYAGASLVDIEAPLPRSPASQEAANKRQKVTEWSSSSRARLKRFLGMLRREELGKALVVTLTYPAEFPAPDDHKVYKYHLKVITTYIVRKWPSCAGIWKLEFQSRGAAHYHLMLFGLWAVPIEEVRQWMQEQWYKIAHNGDRHLGKAGTQVEKIKSVGGAMNYFAKYISKGDQTRPGNFTGRYWGKVNQKCLPLVEAQALELSAKKAFFLRRIARRKMENDVNRGRWRRWLEDMRERSWEGVSRLDWQAAKSAYQGGAESVKMWQRIKEDTIKEEGMVFMLPACYLRMKYDRQHFRIMLTNYRLPRRWKARNNDRVRLLCDASAFVEAIRRLDAPASSFALWSRNEDA